mgnify:CR=1 FL=1
MRMAITFRQASSLLAQVIIITCGLATCALGPTRPRARACRAPPPMRFVSRTERSRSSMRPKIRKSRLRSTIKLAEDRLTRAEGSDHPKGLRGGLDRTRWIPRAHRRPARIHRYALDHDKGSTRDIVQAFGNRGAAAYSAARRDAHEPRRRRITPTSKTPRNTSRTRAPKPWILSTDIRCCESHRRKRQILKRQKNRPTQIKRP